MTVDVSNLPTVLDLPAAAALLGIGRTNAYELVRDDACDDASHPARQADQGADPAAA